MTTEQAKVVIFDNDESSLISTKKCIEYVWAGPILTASDIYQAQKYTSHSATLDMFVFTCEAFDNVDIASWLLGVGYKGRVIILYQNSETIPRFLPCTIAKTIAKPAKLSDFNQVFCLPKNSDKALFLNKQMTAKLLDRRDSLFLEFQPQYRSQGEKLWGFECLTRFQIEGEKVDTSLVLNAIERYSFMEHFSQLFFTRLAEILPAFKNVHLAINLSLYNVEKYDLLSVIEKTFDETIIVPENITFEFSYDAYFSSKSRAINLLTNLRSFGYRLSIEDSTKLVDSLDTFPLLIDEVKVPISLMEGENMLQHQRAMSALAHSKDVSIVFAKVEKYQHVKLASSVAPNSIVQGYYLAPPTSIENVFDLLRDQ